MDTGLEPLLRQMLNGGASEESAADLQGQLLAQLSQKAERDPLLALLITRLTAPAARPAERRRSADADIPAVLESLQARLEILQGRSNALAAALGACRLCWGADANCPQCFGAGRPGWACPHPLSFAQWAGPALERLQAMNGEAGTQASRSMPSGDHFSHYVKEN
jgi:hypothetical protein